MLLAALRDLQWRRKRFAITMVATGLVFAMSLVLSGLAQSFPNETNRLLNFLGAEKFVSAAGTAGPFYNSSFLPSSTLPDAVPLTFSGGAVPTKKGLRQVAMFGMPFDYMAKRSVADGSVFTQPGEIVVDRSLGYRVGDVVPLGGVDYKVVGRLNNHTMFGGQPTMFFSLGDSYTLFTGGQQVTRTFIAPSAGTTGTSASGLASFTRAQAKADLARPLKGANDAINFVKILMWVIAACIIGSVVFLSALERTRDFAVFKATGVSTKSIGAGLMLQAVLLAVLASVVALLLGLVMAPAFPMPVEIPTSAMVALPVIAIGIGVFASLSGLRRTATVSPALAFGGP
jgi:putative ABC transport system permease protein